MLLPHMYPAYDYLRLRPIYFVNIHFLKNISRDAWVAQIRSDLIILKHERYIIQSGFTLLEVVNNSVVVSNIFVCAYFK